MLSAAAVVPHSALSVFRQASVVCSYHTIANSFSSLRSRAANLVLGSLQPKSLLQSTHQTDFAALRVLEEHTRQLQQVMDTLQQQQGDTAPEQHVQQQQWTSQQEHFMKLAFEQVCLISSSSSSSWMAAPACSSQYLHQPALFDSVPVAGARGPISWQ